MTKHSPITLFIVAATLFLFSCGGHGGSHKLADGRDSLSYVIGMNIAYNIMQMDSTINADVVVGAIDDALRGRERFSLDEGKRYLLNYMNYDIYERVRHYEEQYLADLAASDGEVVRANSGLTYKVAELGDMNHTVQTERDTVAIVYRVTNMAGEEVDLVSERADTLRTRLDKYIKGLQEGVRLVGQGGSITLWIPSSMAYGSAGDSEKGIKSNEMLRYEVQVVEIKHRR